MTDLLLTNLRTIGTHHCDGEVGKEAADEIERLRAELAALRAERDLDGARLTWLERNPRHESAPYFDDDADAWGFPYEVSNAGGHGGGVGFRHFGSLRAAIDAAIAAEGEK